MRYLFLVLLLFLGTINLARSEELPNPVSPELTKLTYKLKGAACGVCLKDLEKAVSLLPFVSKLQISRANGLTGMAILLPTAELTTNAKNQVEAALKEKGQTIVESKEEIYDSSKPLLTNDSAWERLIQSGQLRAH